jgi:hypothetical protein
MIIFLWSFCVITHSCGGEDRHMKLSHTGNKKGIITPVTIPYVSKLWSANVKLVNNQSGFYFITEVHNISYPSELTVAWYVSIVRNTLKICN